MAASTTDVLIRPEDGWTLVATDPTYLLITPHVKRQWFVAVTAGSAPASTLVGAAMRGGDDRFTFETGALTGTVYVRVPNPVDQVNRGMMFGVIKA
mgnify:CR=1 FL=1